MRTTAQILRASITIMASSATSTAPTRRPNVAIFLCDMQESFRARIADFDLITKTAQKVLKAAVALSIPIHTTEQNPTRLGPTIPELLTLLPSSSSSPSSPPALPIVEKTAFSMLAAPAIAARLTNNERAAQWTVALVGIEAHVCVTQTALDLRAAGHRAYVLADAVGSCNPGEVRLALERLRAENSRPVADDEGDGEGGRAGRGSITVTSSESFLFEVMRDAAIPEFRDVLKVVKETAADTAAATKRMAAL